MNATTREISNSDDIIDSHDIIERIAYLENALDVPENDRDEDEARELAALRNLAEQGETFEDWQYGVALIRDSYFVTYAEELAEDIGAIDRNASWPLRHIDWEAAADELQTDYTDVEFDGVTYWAR